MRILAVVDTSGQRKRRRLRQQSEAGTPPQLEVTFRVEGLESEDAADEVAADISAALQRPESDPASLLSLLAERGLLGVTVVYVAPPTVVVLNEIVVAAEQPSEPPTLTIVIGARPIHSRRSDVVLPNRRPPPFARDH